MITVRGAKTMPPAGMSRPVAASRALSPAATATPSPRPTAEASRPTVTASSRTEDRIWRRVAPSARSRPFSRVRWATVIENVLNIWNAPTIRAATANTMSRVLKPPSWFMTLERASLAACWPVTASTPAGSAACRLRASWVCETPGCAANKMLSNLPGWPTSFCAAGTVNRITEVPPGLEALPKRAIPVIGIFRGGPCTSTVAVPPTARWPSLALFWSMTISLSARGGRPAARTHGLSCPTVGQDRPMVPVVVGLPSAWPLLPTRRA